MRETSPSNAGGMGSIPGQGTNCSTCLEAKKTKTCNGSNVVTNSIKNFKMVHVKKKKKSWEKKKNSVRYQLAPVKMAESKVCTETSLVVPWLRILLAMQGMWVHLWWGNWDPIYDSTIKSVRHTERSHMTQWKPPVPQLRLNAAK